MPDDMGKPDLYFRVECKFILQDSRYGMMPSTFKVIYMHIYALCVDGRREVLCKADSAEGIARTLKGVSEISVEKAVEYFEKKGLGGKTKEGLIYLHGVAEKNKKLRNWHHLWRGEIGENNVC